MVNQLAEAANICNWDDNTDVELLENRMGLSPRNVLGSRGVGSVECSVDELMKFTD
jgi:hypothetical protein